MKLATRWMGGLAAALAVAVAPLAAIAQTPAPAILSAEEARAELDALYAGLEQAHYDLFAHRSRADYDRLHAAMRADINGPTTRDAAAILFQKFAAYGRVGHARVDEANAAFVRHIQAGGRFLPLFVRVDGDRLMLTATADQAGRFRAGAEVLALDGQPPAAWLERLGAWVSAERPYMAHAQMEETFPILLWFALPDAEGIEVVVRGADGAVVEGRVPAIGMSELGAIREAWPTPSLDTDFSVPALELLGDGLAYLRPGPFQDGDAPGSFVAFVEDAFGRMLAAGTTDLVIDLRNNPGGDNSFSDPMIAWFADAPFRFASSFTLKASPQAKAWYAALPEPPTDGILARLAAAEAAQPDGARYPFELDLNPPRPEPRFHGRIHVLVNRHSYSNAASAAALIQDYGFGEVLGEETADVPTTYASVMSFDLPRTGIRVTFPKSRIVRPSGDESLRGVVPDHPLPREPIGAREDVVLARALAAIRAAR
jgi:hypothetical protein